MFRSQLRKKNDISDGGLVSQKHDQPVDADAFTGRGWHAIFQRANEIFI